MSVAEVLRQLGLPTSLRWGERGGTTLEYGDRCEVTVAPGGLVRCIEGSRASVCDMLLEPQDIPQWLGAPDLQDNVGTVWREPGLCILQRGRPHFVVILGAAVHAMQADWTPTPWELPVTRWEVDGIRLGQGQVDVERGEGRPTRTATREGRTWHVYRSGVQICYRGGFVAEVRGKVLGRREGEAHAVVAEAGCIVPPASILEQEPPPEYTGADSTQPGGAPNVQKLEERARFFQLVDLRKLLDTCTRGVRGTVLVFTRASEGLHVEAEQNMVKEFHLSRSSHEFFDLLEQAQGSTP